jgi:hypothetical protein
MIPGTHIPGTEATACQTTKEPSMVALVHLCYYCDRLVAVTLDLPTIACYSDTSITTARRGPVAPDALRLAHILTHSHNFAMLMRN